MLAAHFQDTIVALATPPGEGALGIIRLSGQGAVRIADAVWKGKPLSEAATHTLHYGHIVEPSGIDHPSSDKYSGERNSKRSTPSAVIDEAVASIFRAPKSYTGEDVVEFSCHGSLYILQRVLEVCTAAGARPAHPGEFTQRAFLAGKLDLTQAEAVADLIASGSEAAHRAAMHQLRGGFSSELKALREELIGFAALIELELDFSEEDVEFADRAQLRDLLRRIDETTSQLIYSFRLGNAVKEGVAVAIVGRPNAGKSTLLNALLGEERAIVSDIPGTTRDTIEEVITLEGIRFRFIDTAGIRQHTDDAIEAIGIQRSREKAAAAGLVLYVIDLTSADWNAEQMEAYDWLEEMGKPFLLVHNKSSLYVPAPYPDTGDPELDDEIAMERGAEMPQQSVMVDAKSKLGLDQLRRRIVKSIVGSSQKHEATVVTNARHHAALLRVQEEVEAVERGMAQGLSGDLLSHHIRQALFHIGSITGEVQIDRDVLGAIFSKFCIGK